MPRKSPARKVTAKAVAPAKSQPARSAAGRPSSAAAPKEARTAAETSLADTELSRQGIRLGFLIHDVSRMRRAAYDQLMKPLNFTRARWWILANLSRRDGMMQSELADILDVGKASLGAVVEQLEADGWIERRPDPSDKRAKRVYLSKAAHAFVRKMTLQENQFNERILDRLSITDRGKLIQLLSEVKTSLSQLNLEFKDGAEN